MILKQWLGEDDLHPNFSCERFGRKKVNYSVMTPKDKEGYLICVELECSYLLMFSVCRSW